MQGDPADARRFLARHLAAGWLVNGLGALLVAVYLLVVFPYREEDAPSWFTPAAGFALTAVVVLVTGISAGFEHRRYAGPVLRWLAVGGPPGPGVGPRLLGMPAHIAWRTLVNWIASAVVFTAIFLPSSVVAGAEVAVSIALTGLTVAAAQFLVVERLGRPLVARLLQEGGAPPSCTRRLGVGRQLLLAWLLCSAVPVVMLALIPVGRQVDDPQDLVAPIWFVAAAGLAAGFAATKLATQRVTEPLARLRAAAAAVEEGRLDVRVPVDDASEIGTLQAGFNRMVDGLAERERLRRLVDSSVGREVAAEALRHGTGLGGQTRDVSVLFVDVVGSTALAAELAPEEVVARLNRFFAIVVEVVERHGGVVNKFEGDGGLCLFGAPAVQPDHASRALACAQALHAALAADGGLDAAIGVSGGTVVAGWMGAESRFEYTVIGDPVNEAARLTDLAKREPGRVVAAARTVRQAGADWALGEEVVLRGRRVPTRLARPAVRQAAGA
jgi:adenylate cyclase